MACVSDAYRCLLLPVLIAALCCLVAARAKKRGAQKLVEWGLMVLAGISGTWALYAVAVWVLGLFGRGPLGE